MAARGGAREPVSSSESYCGSQPSYRGPPHLPGMVAKCHKLPVEGRMRPVSHLLLRIPS